jgi:hypothetical protein
LCCRSCALQRRRVNPRTAASLSFVVLCCCAVRNVAHCVCVCACACVMVGVALEVLARYSLGADATCAFLHFTPRLQPAASTAPSAPTGRDVDGDLSMNDAPTSSASRPASFPSASAVQTHHLFALIAVSAARSVASTVSRHSILVLALQPNSEPSAATSAADAFSRSPALGPSSSLSAASAPPYRLELLHTLSESSPIESVVVLEPPCALLSPAPSSAPSPSVLPRAFVVAGTREGVVKSWSTEFARLLVPIPTAAAGAVGPRTPLVLPSATPSPAFAPAASSSAMPPLALNPMAALGAVVPSSAGSGGVVPTSPLLTTSAPPSSAAALASSQLFTLVFERRLGVQRVKVLTLIVWSGRLSLLFSLFFLLSVGVGWFVVRCSVATQHRLPPFDHRRRTAACFVRSNVALLYHRATVNRSDPAPQLCRMECCCLQAHALGVPSAHFRHL